MIDLLKCVFLIDGLHKTTNGALCQARCERNCTGLVNFPHTRFPTVLACLRGCLPACAQVLGDVTLPEDARLTVYRTGPTPIENLELRTLANVSSGNGGALLRVNFDASGPTYGYLEVRQLASLKRSLAHTGVARAAPQTARLSEWMAFNPIHALTGLHALLCGWIGKTALFVKRSRGLFPVRFLF